MVKFILSENMDEKKTQYKAKINKWAALWLEQFTLMKC